MVRKLNIDSRVLTVVLFLIAQDGTLDQPRSRGLGDVYNRQMLFYSQNYFAHW